MSDKRARKMKRSAKRGFAPLEPLEVRMLLSAVISVYYNNILIPNGVAQASSDFLDMPTTYTDAIGKATRTFQLEDLGADNLILTGSPDLVTIGGTNAADFSVIQQPSGTLTTGVPSNFTIAFTPQGAGDRTAVVTIASNDPNSPTFDFTIQGRGVDVTETAADGLQVSITVPGSGATTVNGSSIVLRYTRYSLDGTALDTSHGNEGTPVTYVYGTTEPYAGWNEGLSNIQEGESRSVFVPASLDNATVSSFFAFSAVSIASPTNPSIQVGGNGYLIPNGSTTSEVAVFTDFQDVPTNSLSGFSSATREFQIGNMGTTDLTLSGSPDLVTISGDNAADFSVTSQPGTTISSLGTTSFTIAFTPLGTGQRTAVVMIASNDPDTPTYSFTIQGHGLQVTTAADGLETATTTQGSGTGAVQGSKVTLNYGRFLMNGTVLDANYLSTTLDYVIGNGELYPGWDEGLLGIMTGESRTVFVPTSISNESVASFLTFSAVSGAQPAIAVQAGGVTIANNSNVPSTGNFTDFGPLPTSANGSLNSNQRTFQILNSGAGNLILTGDLSQLITITGNAASDFSLTSNPASTIAAGSTGSTFTITFTPSASGVRDATVAIATNDPSTPTFSFSIEGEGQVTTALPDGVQTATTTTGSGTGATQGMDLRVTFTGTLYDGTIFDSATSSSSPTHMIIGNAALPPGLSAGLLGIKAGETRMIFIPAEEGWGATAHGSIPANSALIYTVNVTSLGAAMASIVVTGNGQTIASGDTTPSAADFTDFGPMSTTANALLGQVTRTYQISDPGGLPLTLTGSSRVTISGANAGDFTVTTLPSATIASGTSSAFTITFTPKGKGTRQAVVTIVSNSATSPSFTFAIQGTGVATATTPVSIATTNGIASSTTDYPLQIGTITAGKGAGAANGMHLVVDYTGYLLDGTIFDSSLNPGRTPFDVALSPDANLIQGWITGLVGIKVGETRILVIPAGLGYGTSGSGTIPANATLIFKVTCLSQTLPLMSVYGNGTVIAAGDKSPSTDDFTDFRFMSTTVDASIGSCFRTFYLVNNNTDTNEYLSSAAVTITGRNASDFTVSSQPVTVISGGTYSSFQINFAPNGTGVRTATVNITVNDAKRSTYSFNIQGTGLATTNDTNYGYQYATLVAGTGVGAAGPNGTVNGDIVLFDYTAFLLDGSVYDSSNYLSSQLRGKGPIEIYAGGVGNGLPVGLDLALVGMKEGETRAMLLSPVASGTESSHAESTSILLEVRRQATPVLEVGAITTSYTYMGIAYGENSPAASDNTLLTLPAGSTATTLTAAYYLNAYGSTTATPLNFTADGSILHLATGDAKKFSSYALSDSVNGFRYIVVFTAPTTVTSAAHTFTTKAHIYTTDPNHPDYWFAISADVTPWVDLTSSIGAITSGTIVSGAATTYNIPISVTNSGNTTVSYTSSGVDFQVYLHNNAAGTDSSSDVLLTAANYTSSALKGLAAHSSKSFKIPVAVPITVNTGDYKIVVKMNTAGAVSEYNTSNTTTATQTIHVVKGTQDLAASVGPVSAFSAGTITSGTGTSYNIPVTVTNLGNFPVTYTTSGVDFQVYLHNSAAGTDNSSDLLLTAANYTSSALKALAAGKSTSVTIPVALPVTVNSGDYKLVVKVNSSGAISETTATNNTATSTQTLHVAKGNRDLVATVGAVSAFSKGTVTSGAGTTYNIPVIVTNQGNTVVTYTTSGVDFQMYLHGTAAGTDNSSDVLLTVANYTTSALKNLGAGKTATVTIPVTIPVTADSGDYLLVVNMNSSGAVPEASATNNTAISTQTLHIAHGAADLIISAGTVAALSTGTLTSGATTSFTIPVVITNQGNLPISATSSPIDVAVYLHNNAAGTDNTTDTWVMATNYTRGLGANKSTTIKVPVTIPITAVAGDYQFVFKVNTSVQLPEATTTNNAFTPSQTLHVTQGYRDLVTAAGTASTITAGTLTSGGPTTINVPVQITNQGNLPIPTLTNPIDVAIYLHNTTAVDNTSDVLLTTANFTSLSNTVANRTVAVNVPVTVPLTVGTGDYQLVAEVNTLGQLTELTTTNNSFTFAPTIHVVQGYNDLVSTVGTSSAFSGTITSGAGTSYNVPVIVTNQGNVPITYTTSNVDFLVYLHANSATDNSSDLLLTATNYTSSALSGLGSSLSTTVTIPVTIPVTVNTGDYSFVVKTNTLHGVSESNTDNTTTSTQPIHVVQGFRDLVSTVDTVSALTGTLTSGTGTSYNIPVSVTNQGNLIVSYTTSGVDFQVYLHNTTATDNSSDVLISASGFTSTALSSLSAGASAPMTIPVSIPITVNSGDYNLIVQTNTAGAVSESNTDNTITSAQTIHVVQGYRDLVDSVGTITMPSGGSVTSGAGTSITIPVLLTNQGNLPISATTSPVDVMIYLHNTTATDNSSDVLLTATTNTTTALRVTTALQTVTTNVTVTVPITVGTGDYVLVAKVNGQGTLSESVTTNNSASSTQTLHVVQGFYALQGQLTSATFPTTLAANTSLSGVLNVTFQNTGNLTTPSSQQLVLQVVAIDQSNPSNRINVGDPSTVTLGALTANSTSVAFAVSGTLSAGLASGSYKLGFSVTPTPTLTGISEFIVSAKSDASIIPLTIT